MASKVYVNSKVSEGTEITMYPGDQLEGILLSKRSEVKTKFKATNLVFIKLEEPFQERVATDGKKAKKDEAAKNAKTLKNGTLHPKGTVVTMWVSTGLNAIMEIPERSEVLVKCVGTKDTGKGNPMTTYEIQYNEPSV